MALSPVPSHHQAQRPRHIPSFLLQANVRVARTASTFASPSSDWIPPGSTSSRCSTACQAITPMPASPPAAMLGWITLFTPTGVFSPCPALCGRSMSGPAKTFQPRLCRGLIAQESGFDSRRMTSVQAVVTALRRCPPVGRRRKTRTPHAGVWRRGAQRGTDSCRAGELPLGLLTGLVRAQSL